MSSHRILYLLFSITIDNVLSNFLILSDSTSPMGTLTGWRYFSDSAVTRSTGVSLSAAAPFVLSIARACSIP